MKVAVVGGGVAGLAAATTLQEAGATVQLFEAEARVGGKVSTFDADGFRCEDGPNSLAAASPTALALVERCGLSAEVREARPPRTRYLFLRGRVRRAPSVALLRPLGWARALLEPAFRGAAREDESLEAFLVRHLGVELGRLAALLMATGVFAGDPAKLSAREAFPRLTGLAERSGSLLLGAFSASRQRGSGPRSLWTLATGLQTLPLRLAQALGEAVRVGTRVTALSPEGRGFSVEHAHGTERFDALICALPSGAAAALLQPFAPDAARELSGIAYAPLAVVHLGIRMRDLPSPIGGFGLLDGDGSLTLLGTLFASSLFADRAPEGHLLLTTLVGGTRKAETLARSDDELIGLIRADFARVLGLDAPPVFARIRRWPLAVPQINIGHGARLARLERSLSAHPCLVLAGAAYRGVSVEQALSSGARAARRILDQLERG